MIKKILLTIASIFLVLQSYSLITTIPNIEIESIPIQFFIAWILNVFITGVFAFLGFAYPTQRLLSNAYYQIHNSKRLKSVYKFLRIDLFRRFLLATFWKSKDMRKKFFDGKKSGLENLIRQSKKSEFGHLLPLIILTGLSIYFLTIKMFLLSFFIMLWNVLGNLLPIILQRHHRMRIQIINKRKMSLSK